MNKTQSNKFQSIPNFLAYGLGGGGTGILLYASINSAQFFSLCGVAIMVSGASFGGGALLGFLFGIPMSVQPVTIKYQQTTSSSEENSTASETHSEAVVLKTQPEAMVSASKYRGNTNLEDISNWLTKMLLGVGLTQIPAIAESIRNFSEFASPALGGDPSGKVFTAAILIYFLICGFIAGYMWARLNLARMFTEADNALEQKIDDQKQQISGLLKYLINFLFTSEIEKGSAPCELKPFDGSWLPLAIIGDQIAAMYRKYKSGVVIAMGHAFVLGHDTFDGSDRGYEEYQIIVTNVFDAILSPYTQKRRVLVSTGHGETHTVDDISMFKLNTLKEILELAGYTIIDIEKPISSAILNNGDILIIANASCNFEDKEVESVRNFVSKGGSLLVVGIAWSWASYNFPEKGARHINPYIQQEYEKGNYLITEGQDRMKIRTYPMNKLVTPYGMLFLAKAISLKS